MKKFLYIFIVFLITACSGSKVMVDYDSELDFASFKSFNFYEDVGAGLNELDVKRVTTVIQTALKAKGLVFNENPSILINVDVKTSETQNNNTIGVGIGSGGRNGGFGISGGIPIGGKKLNETFKIEFVNTKTNNLIWEGVLNSTVKEKRTPEEKELHYGSIIDEILKQYPPK
ncbi:DUF4136 domain-containing protein [Polaribacter sp. MED152]|uniref:DUF4136 domain-containing protein n=1 Tax=Polaribacter sp. MED152 TaxID=313598 RepID=UPI0000689A50|nr:DUF4136 domain-containing protein [Polaribacter sp. MED152]EAQ40818.1 hypothetical protein MED152_12309 [Polaribacter sp. MED152]